MTEGMFWFLASELLLCGAWEMYEQLRQEFEEPVLPIGTYRLVWKL